LKNYVLAQDELQLEFEQSDAEQLRSAQDLETSVGLFRWLYCAFQTLRYIFNT